MFKSLSNTYAAKRNFLRRTKATAPPETTETASTDNTETTTHKYTRRGNSKYKTRKELEKSVERNEIENISRRPSFNGARRNERPATRKFALRRRPGGVNATSTTLSTNASLSTTTALPSTTRRGFRIAARRKPVSSTTTASTTTSTLATTTAFEDEESLQEIGDTDAIEDPSLEPRFPTRNFKVQRRPLVVLKDSATDQNPSATNEEENKRQSKKYSASIKQNQLDDLVKKKQETNTERHTTTEDFSPETAVAIAAHQLITAPIPIITDFDNDGLKPTRKTHTTVEYKYTNQEYNKLTDKTPTNGDYQSTPTYKYSTLGGETTAFKAYDSIKDSVFGSTKVPDFDAAKVSEVPKTTLHKYPTTPDYNTGYSIFTSPKISAYDIPQPANFPNTANTAINPEYIRTTSNGYSVSEYDSPKITPTPFGPNSSAKPVTNSEFIRTTIGDSYTSPRDFDSKLSYLPKSTPTNFPTNTVPQGFISTYPETPSEFVTRNSPTYVPKFTSGYVDTINQEFAQTTASNALESSLPSDNLPKISTTLSAPPPSRNFDRNAYNLVEPLARTAGDISSKSTEATKSLLNLNANVVTAGYSGIQRGSSRFRNEKLIPVPVVNTGYSTVGYTEEPSSYFTREYLLESPVTKIYDEEYQYLSPATTPQTPAPAVTRKVVRKKIHRRISTTQRPTQSPTTRTTVKPARTPSPQPFDKVKEKKNYRPIASYDYYDDNDEKVAVKYVEGTKVVMHKNGVIECLDIGNFPHPSSCKKFISCARIENGSLLGWEYVCPKGLSFDPVGGICNWSAGLGCNEKEKK